MNKELVDVKGDGSCFYRALYGYLLLNKNFDKSKIKSINDKLKCDINEMQMESERLRNDKDFNLYLKDYEKETNWVKCFRNYLHNYIINNKKQSENYYNFIKSLYENNKDNNESFISILNELFKNSWITKMLIKEIKINNRYKKELNFEVFPDFNEFSEQFKISIKNINEYTTGIEVEIIKDILKEIGINIEIIIFDEQITKDNLNTILEKFPTNPKKNTIYLLNINQKHYNFVYYYKSVTFKSASPTTTSRTRASPPDNPIVTLKQSQEDKHNINDWVEFKDVSPNSISPPHNRIITSKQNNRNRKSILKGTPLILTTEEFNRKNQEDQHSNAANWVKFDNSSPTEKGMLVGGKKRFMRPKICINGKLYICHIDKDNKNKKYIKIKNKKLYV